MHFPHDPALVALIGAAGSGKSAVAQAFQIGAYGAGGRAWYRPRAGDPSFWEWEADSP